jgi:predicted GTPase
MAPIAFAQTLYYVAHTSRPIFRMVSYTSQIFRFFVPETERSKLTRRVKQATASCWHRPPWEKQKTHGSHTRKNSRSTWTWTCRQCSHC